MFRNGLWALVLCMGLLILALAFTLPTQAQTTPTLTPIEQLGKSLYFDEHLSKNANQSCATCHAPETGHSGPDAAVNAHGAVYSGSDPSLFGNRKPPSAAYAGDSPKLTFDSNLKAWVGGMFWDGRADGSTLGDPLAEQAKGPFLNPLEMGIASPEVLCGKVKAGGYTNLFALVWGAGSPDCTQAAQVYDQIGKSIAAFERSAEVSPFNSKFDQFWDTAKGKQLDVVKISAVNWTQYRSLGLSDPELAGLAVFNDPTRANCASCHSLKPGSKGYPLFTNYSFANTGVPKNAENPFYTNVAYNPDGANWVDTGLGGFLAKNQPQLASQETGKVKVPTLRNVDKRPYADFVKAYGHNGYFKSLPEIIRFYTFRSMISDGRMGMMSGQMMQTSGTGMGMRGGMMRMIGEGMTSSNPLMAGMGGMMMFPTPEVNENLAKLNILPCTDQPYLLAFLQTLSDGYYQKP